MSEERALVPVPPVAVALRTEAHIPATREELVGNLNGLGDFLHLGGWATAAAVYAWTEPWTGGGRPPKGITSDAFLTIEGFARLGIRGLASLNTVRLYRSAWKTAIAEGWAEPVAPGDVVALPTQDFGLVRPKKEPVETPSLPPGLFQTIVADPPWDVLTGPDWGSGGKARPLVYPAMDVEAIRALPVKTHAADDAHLYLWTINAYLDAAYEVAEAWGFTPSTLLVWCKKPHGIGLGGTYVLTTEYVLFARRGALPALRRVDTTWFDWPRREHSVKPDEFFEMVESVSPGDADSRLEMFGRRPRDGWTVWGSDPGLEITEAPDDV